MKTLLEDSKLLLLLAFLTFFSIFAQSQLVLNWDASYLLIATEKMLAGGTYGKDFFETNLPIILFIYTPVILIKSIINISTVFLFKAYIYLLGFISFLLCFSLITKILDQHEYLLKNILLFFLILSFLLIPGIDFGQREHLYYMLSLPYVFLILARSANITTDKKIQVLVGLLAGLAFAIKPYYALTFVLIELYYIFKVRNLFAVFRIESILIFCIIILHVGITYFFFPEYQKIILPMALHNYYMTMGLPWQTMTSSVQFKFGLAVILFSIVTILSQKFRSHQTKQLLILLTLYLIANLFFIFLLQRAVFANRYFPTQSTNILLLALIIGNFASKEKFHKSDYFTLISGFFIFGYFNSTFLLTFTGTFILNRVGYSVYFVCILTLITYLMCRKQHFLRIACSVSFIVIISMLYSLIVERAVAWYLFPIVMIMLTCLYALLLLRLRVKLLNCLAITCFTIVAFAQPTFMTQLHYFADEHSDRVSYLNQFLNLYGNNKKVSFYTTTITLAFPLVHYSNVNYASRFPLFWMLPAIEKRLELNPEDNEAKQEKQEIIQYVTEDIIKLKPDLVFVDTSLLPAYFDKSFDFINFFSENPAFRAAWKNYSYFAKLNLNFGSGLPYPLRVYRRLG